MSSEIRVNTLNNRSGLSTVSLTDTGLVISGITTIANVTVGGATTEVVISGSITASGNIESTGTGALKLPQGTTAQRPSDNNPYIRYNTTNSALEFYNGTDWVEIISDYFPSGSVILG